jgi:hypothetical protein
MEGDTYYCAPTAAHVVCQALRAGLSSPAKVEEGIAALGYRKADVLG